MPTGAPLPPYKPLWEHKPLDIINIVYTLSRIYAGVLTPVLRKGFGVKAFTSYPITLIFMFLSAAYLNCREIALYMPGWLAMVVIHRLTPDRSQDSRYQGYPWLTRLIVRGELRARTLEPFLVFFAAIFIRQDSEPLSNFLLGCSVSLFMVLMTEVQVMHAQKIAIGDAEIRARQKANMQRGYSGWRD